MNICVLVTRCVVVLSNKHFDPLPKVFRVRNRVVLLIHVLLLNERTLDEIVDALLDDVDRSVTALLSNHRDVHREEHNVQQPCREVALDSCDVRARTFDDKLVHKRITHLHVMFELALDHRC